jgi:serine/threonine-protein kinase
MDDRFTLPNGQLAILMPFCAGVPLDQYVARHGGKLSPHRAFYVACHVARALNHAHTLGIVHRDVKPNNVFVEDDDNDVLRCRLLDFGVARRLNPNPGMPTHTVQGPCGTPDYMAPEQNTRPGQATAAADLFSLAVMIWQMVTGGLPWGVHSDPATLYVSKLYNPPDPPPGDALSAEWEQWLRAGLLPDPTVRPSLRQFMQALARALPGIGRLVPSGAEILQTIARSLWDESGPDDVTLRNKSNATLLPAWPERDPMRRMALSTPKASAPEVQQAREPSQPAMFNVRQAMVMPVAPDVAADAADAAAPCAPSTPPSSSAPSAPPIDLVPGAPPRPMATTISASNGAVLSTQATPRGWKLAFVGAAAVVFAGVATFAIATVGGQRGSAEPATTMQPALITRPATAPTTSESIAPRRTVPTTTAPTTTAPVPIAPVPTAPVPTAPQPAPAPAMVAPPTKPTSTTAPPARTAPRSRDAGAPRPSSTTSPVKTGSMADPDRNKAHAPDAGSGHKFDPNAVGGQEEE